MESFYSNLDDVTIQIKALVKKTLKDIITDEAMDEEVAVDLADWFIAPFEVGPNESDDAYKKRRAEAGKATIGDLQELKSPQEVLGDRRGDEESIVSDSRSVIADGLDTLRGSMARRT